MSDWNAEERADFLLQHAESNPALLRTTLIEMISKHHQLREEVNTLRARIQELERQQQESDPIALPSSWKADNTD